MTSTQAAPRARSRRLTSFWGFNKTISKGIAYLAFRLGGLVVFLATLATAQNPPTDADSPKAPSRRETIVVTATYSPAPLEECDRTVDVIEIDQSPTLFRSWADALRLDSSIDLRQRSPETQGDLSIRGSSFGQTLVLVDGIRINDAQSGHHNLDLPIPFESIQRIEVLHGSGSTLDGADAVGGAANFITAAPVATELRVGATGGNFGTNTQNGSAGFLGSPIGRRAFSSLMSYMAKCRDNSFASDPSNPIYGHWIFTTKLKPRNRTVTEPTYVIPDGCFGVLEISWIAGQSATSILDRSRGHPLVRPPNPFCRVNQSILRHVSES